MKINQSDIAIVLGDSPFLNEIEDKLQYTLDRYFSIGINRVINKFRTNMQVCLDSRILPVANSHPEIPTVTLKAHGALVQKEQKEFFDTYAFDFRLNTANDILKDKKLAWCGFTHDYALSYLISKGWKYIILIGAADFTQGTHFSNEEIFNPSRRLIELSKKFIEEVCTQKAKIFTCNPKSSLSVPRLDIERLLV